MFAVAWLAGAQLTVAAGCSSDNRANYLARWESPELRSGIGSRSIVWGSLEFAKSFL
jgi:hypothetical protein